MTDIFGILSIGRGALLTQQKAIDVTGHNIANVNTPGFSRQRVNMETREPFTSMPGQMGSGVRAAEIQRVYDRFLGGQINHENQNLGRWETHKGGLERVEMIFDESTGYGLNQALSEFWNAWQDVVNNPSGQAERTVLVSRSEVLAGNFTQIDADLKQLQRDIDISIRGAVGEINQLSAEIAALNEEIALAEVNGQNANDFRDKRDLLLKELSALIDIESFEGDGGKVTVMAAGGRPLVENTTSWRLSTEDNGSGHQDVVWIDGDGNPVTITGAVSRGALKGWLEVRDEYIPEYLTRLDTLAGSIISEVNTIHQGGFGLDGSTGNDFFSGTSASDMAVDANIVSDTNLIAAAENPGGAPGDNGNAIEIAELQNSLTTNGNTATFDDYYNALVSDIGTQSQKATINYEHQSAVVTQLDNYRETISGVSLDEEMVNLVKFQHAYDAAAKLIVTVDEMLATVINMV
jgi:flagellar hook-associated protein 1 FlgK